MAVHSGLLAREADLVEDFRWLPGLLSAARFGCVHSCYYQSAFWILLCPPVQQQTKTRCGLLNFPIKLRSQVINPTILQPFPGIRVQSRVSISTLDLFRVARPPNPKWADAKFHPGFCLLDSVIYTVDKSIYVFSPPVVSIKLAASSITFPTCVIRKFQISAGGIFLGVRIKVIVKVNSIDVVPLHHIHHHGERIVLHLFLTRIQPKKSAILPNPFRVCFRYMRR